MPIISNPWDNFMNNIPQDLTTLKYLEGDKKFIDGDFSRAEPREHNSREEGERQYRMYQSDQKGTEGNSRG